MRTAIVFGFALLSSIVFAIVNITEIEATIPTCAANCFIPVARANLDLINNPDVSCHNDTLYKPMSACIQTSCSFEEQKEFSIITRDICKGQSIPSRGLGALVEAITLGPITLAFVAGRIYSKRKFSKALGVDDHLILAATSFYSGTIPLYIVNTILGFGKHYWHLNPLKIRALLLIFYIGELSYLATMPIIKLSILFFYLRIFQRRWFRISVWIMICFVALSGVAFVITGTVQCLPIAKSFDKSIDGKCVDLNAVAYANAGIGIFQDVVILVLPIPEILQLKMRVRKKMALIVMFSVGLLAVLTSILRLPSLHDFAVSLDQTWDNQTGSLWSLAEQSVAMICACMPAVRQLLASYLPKIFNFDESGRGEANHNNDHDSPHQNSPLNRQTSKRKPLSLFHLTTDFTTDFSSQGTTITTCSRADIQYGHDIQEAGNAKTITTHNQVYVGETDAERTVVEETDIVKEDLGWFKMDDTPLISLRDSALEPPFRCNFREEARERRDHVQNPEEGRNARRWDCGTDPV